MNSGIKERRTRILLTLFLLGRDKSHNIFERTIQQVFSLPSDSPRSRGTLRQMLADQIITKEEEGTYMITDLGLKELALSIPFVRFYFFEWDLVFRILSYEIPERKRKLRDSLRREVSGWGLGPWHRSFWVTPHPIIEDLQKLSQGTEWAEYIQAFEGKPVVGEVSTLLEKVWAIQDLESSYRKLFKDWHAVLSAEESNKEQKFKLIVNSYIEILKNDPGLPKQLLGEHWIGYEAYSIFQEMKKILVG